MNSLGGLGPTITSPSHLPSCNIGLSILTLQGCSKGYFKIIHVMYFANSENAMPMVSTIITGCQSHNRNLILPLRYPLYQQVWPSSCCKFYAVATRHNSLTVALSYIVTIVELLGFHEFCTKTGDGANIQKYAVICEFPCCISALLFISYIIRSELLHIGNAIREIICVSNVEWEHMLTGGGFLSLCSIYMKNSSIFSCYWLSCGWWGVVFTSPWMNRVSGG